MSYQIYIGILSMVAAGGVLLLVSNSFAYEASRALEAAFDFVEHRLALRARERESVRRAAQQQQQQVAGVRTPSRTGEVVVALPVNKRSTQQLGVARIAA